MLSFLFCLSLWFDVFVISFFFLNYHLRGILEVRDYGRFTMCKWQLGFGLNY